jgi:hypothetical protein
VQSIPRYRAGFCVTSVLHFVRCVFSKCSSTENRVCDMLQPVAVFSEDSSKNFSNKLKSLLQKSALWVLRVDFRGNAEGVG